MKKRMAEAVARKKTEEEQEGQSFCNDGQAIGNYTYTDG